MGVQYHANDEIRLYTQFARKPWFTVYRAHTCLKACHHQFFPGGFFDCVPDSCPDTCICLCQVQANCTQITHSARICIGNTRVKIRMALRFDIFICSRIILKKTFAFKAIPGEEASWPPLYSFMFQGLGFRVQEFRVYGLWSRNVIAAFNGVPLDFNIFFNIQLVLQINWDSEQTMVIFCYL